MHVWSNTLANAKLQLANDKVSTQFKSTKKGYKNECRELDQVRNQLITPATCVCLCAVLMFRSLFVIYVLYCCQFYVKYQGLHYSFNITYIMFTLYPPCCSIYPCTAIFCYDGTVNFYIVRQIKVINNYYV